MRRMFSEEQLNDIIKAMSYTKEEIDAIVEDIIGDIVLQASIYQNSLYLFAPKMYVLNNILYVNAPNVSINQNNLIIA